MVLHTEGKEEKEKKEEVKLVRIEYRKKVKSFMRNNPSRRLRKIAREQNIKTKKTKKEHIFLSPDVKRIKRVFNV